MDAELREVLRCLPDARQERHAGRTFHVGHWHGHEVVAVLTGIGKVAAALTTTMLAERYQVGSVVFTGAAGGLHPEVKVGDWIVAQACLQHDMDASPLFPRHEVPLTGLSRFPVDPGVTLRLKQAAVGALAMHGVPDTTLAELGLTTPRLHEGLIISGDRFVSSHAESEALRAALPDALGVEMEGAAVAQVCRDLHLPFALLRYVSDRADDDAHVDFVRFMDEVASVWTRQLLDVYLQLPA
jgi:adenosylhomocysteine nucleosidase